MRVTPHPARALMSRSALVNLFQPRGCPEVRSMKQVPSSNFSQGEELTEVPDVRTSRKSAPFRVGSLRACGPIRPVTGRRSLPPTSFTRYSIPLPCGRDTTEVGSVGLTQLPTEKNVDRFGWSLYPGGSLGCRRPRPRRDDPTHLPFGHGLSALLAVS
jgi:hypothetical protein